MNKEKENPVYYTKPIKMLSECETGEYVYNDEAKLCYVEKKDNSYGSCFVLHSFGGETSCGNGEYTEVYPITILTDEIMRDMRAHRKKWHDSHIMNAAFNGELIARLSEIMHLDVEDVDYNQKCKEFWNKLDARYEEMRGHARALGICN